MQRNGYESLDHNGIETKNIEQLRCELLKLSPMPDSVIRKVSASVISNDQGYSETIPLILEMQQKNEQGCGIFIGSGGVLSLLPDLAVEVPIVIDSNAIVLEVALVIEQIIIASESPEQVLRALDSAPILSLIAKDEGLLSLLGEYSSGRGEYGESLTQQIQAEAKSYGRYHWTNPERFPIVKKALFDKPTVYILADIRDPQFAQEMSRILKQAGMTITYANLTNVHQWLKPDSMDFLECYPIDPNVPIVYSSHHTRTGESLYPCSQIAINLSDYIKQTDLDDTDLSCNIKNYITTRRGCWIRRGLP